MDSCPCVLEILDTAGTEQLKGQLTKLCLFLGNRGGQLSMRSGNSGHSWNGTVKGTVNKTMSLFQEIEVDSCPCVLEILDTAGTEQLKGQIIKLCLFSGNRGGQLSMRTRAPGHSWDGTVKGTVNQTVSLFGKSRWTAVHASWRS